LHYQYLWLLLRWREIRNYEKTFSDHGSNYKPKVV
jgi:hypothetical protein